MMSPSDEERIVAMVDSLHQDGGSEFQQKSQTGKGKRGETLL